MRFPSWFALILFGVAVLRAAEPARPLVSPIFSDNMVLQQGKPNTIWGWAAAGEEIGIEIAGVHASAKAGADGRWEVQFQPPAAGGPYTLAVRSPQASQQITNVLVGEVWLCSGQSNMAWGLLNTTGGDEEAKTADYPGIRLFRVPQRSAYEFTPVPQGKWDICSPQALQAPGSFSAVAYYFAKKIHRELGVPVGVIQAAVGGSPAESWISHAYLSSLPYFNADLAKLRELVEAKAPPYGNYITHWYDEYDVGGRGDTWAAPTIDEADWKAVTLPGGFAEVGVPDEPAVVWFRKEIELPDPLPAGTARVLLGVVEKMETTFVNGRWVGASSWVENPRNYAVPPGVLRPGKNLIALRVLKVRKDGGFLSPGDALKLQLGDGTVVPLAGSWKAKLSVDARAPHPLPLGYENYPTMPTVLREGMIAPLAPFAIRGALWYQGEANAVRAHQYRTLMPLLISDWRELFGQGDFPFYMVGLPAFTPRRSEPVQNDWAELREAQSLTARSVRNSGVVVAIDTGEADDIHPREKRPVADRLANLALAKTYGKNVVWSGPTLARADVLGGTIRLHFENVGRGLVARGETLEGFAIAGRDRKWRWAQARIEGETVVLSSPDVPHPVAARYAWQGNPPATLFNVDGLPAAPFRTDDWPMTTEAASLRRR